MTVLCKNYLASQKKYLKKIVVETQFEQPTLSSNGTMGTDNLAVSVSHAPTADAYKIFTGTLSDYWQNSSGVLTTGYADFEVYIKDDINISKLKLYTATTLVNDVTVTISGKVNSSDSYTQIGSGTYSKTANTTSTIQVDCSLVNGYIHYLKLHVPHNNNGYYVFARLGQVSIIAITQTISWQECSAEEYEEGIKYYKKVTTETAWTQPTLSANGTLGGNSFAVQGNAEYSSTYPAWKAFDNKSSTWWIPTATANPTNQYLIMYNPIKLRVTNIQITNRTAANTTILTGEVYGSNNNSTWVKLISFVNSATGSGSTWNVDLSTNTEGYNYYKLLELTGSGNSSTSFSIAEVKLTATEYAESTIEVSKQIYNILPPPQRSIDTSNVKKEEELMVSVGKKYLKKIETYIDNYLAGSSISISDYVATNFTYGNPSNGYVATTVTMPATINSFEAIFKVQLGTIAQYGILSTQSSSYSLGMGVLLDSVHTTIIYDGNGEAYSATSSNHVSANDIVWIKCIKNNGAYEVYFQKDNNNEYTLSTLPNNWLAGGVRLGTTDAFAGRTVYLGNPTSASHTIGGKLTKGWISKDYFSLKVNGEDYSFQKKTGGWEECSKAEYDLLPASDKRMENRYSILKGV